MPEAETKPIPEPQPANPGSGTNLSNRDWMAGMAMNALIISFRGGLNTQSLKQITEASYQAADAMFRQSIVPVPGVNDGWLTKTPRPKDET